MPNPATSETNEHGPAGDRGYRSLKRSIKSRGLEIKAIRDKGFRALSSHTDRPLFQGMCTRVEKLYDDFTNKWEETIDYCEDKNIEPTFPSEEDTNYAEEILHFYYEIQSFQIQIKSATESPAARSTTFGYDTSTTCNQSHARAILPKIPIKHFYGDITQWPSFKQLFTSLIKDDGTLTLSERFHYLVSYLGGPAYDAIKHITVVGENFEQAWSVLLKIYDNKRKLATTYLERFLSFRAPTGKPTMESLQCYLSSVTESIASLRNLDIPNLSEYLLCELALRSLDPTTREAFEMSIVGQTYPNFSDLQEFVQNRSNVLRITQECHKPVVLDNHTPKSFRSPNKAQFISKLTPHQALMTHQTESNEASDTTEKQLRANTKTCFICHQDHIVSKCPKFRTTTPALRVELLRQFPGCRNCLNPFHSTNSCNSSFNCRICQRHHHTDLHLDSNNTDASHKSPSSNPSASASTSEQATTSSFVGASTYKHGSVLLGTIIAQIRDGQGKLKRFRGVLDSGSQYSFITEDCARKLQKSTRPFHGSIAGVNQSSLFNIRGLVKISFASSLTDRFYDTEAVIIPSITPFLPQSPIESLPWVDYLSYQLSDPDFMKPAPISFLIGADLYTDVISGSPIVLLDRGPRLVPTVFGFAVMGKIPERNDSGLALMTSTDIAPLLERFWEVEEPALSSSCSPADEQCERIFERTIHRTKEGRYVVSLPFKDQHPIIKPNIKRALNCFYSLEARLNKDPKLKESYSTQMEEYKTLGHMRVSLQPPSYILPHHAVRKGSTGNVRVVFDASFPTCTGSLNDHLLTGPKLQADIPAILSGFRRHQFVFTCDIVKMFRQIWLHPDHRRYQTIAWRTDKNEPVQFYELNTVTFGLCCSPYLAQRVLKQHALNYQHLYPEASNIILNHTYVDDIVAGHDTEAGLLLLKSSLIKMLREGGFELDKWRSNCWNILEAGNVPQQPVSFYSEDSSVTRVLGMKWIPNTDTFSYDVTPPDPVLTKRAILSAIARLYDPLGLVAPITFLAKRILQQTWQLDLGWDDPIPIDLRHPWLQFINELPSITKLSIPRAFPTSVSSYQLVCFSDASSHGYCATIYLRSMQNGCFKLTLVKAKTRLAPLKPITIPRLELCGAHLLASLLKASSHLSRELDINQVFCFSDSAVVLAWLKTPPQMLQTFVANRVQYILEHSEPHMWYHIKGTENPADVGSRGIAPSVLNQHHLWWGGPDWAQLPITDWPIYTESAIEEVPELKKLQPITLMISKPSSTLVEYAGKHSSLQKFIRVIALLKRFIFNCRISKAIKHLRITGPVSAKEYQEANHHFLKILHHVYYPDMYADIDFNQRSAELRQLNAFIDPEGLIRVGGRLSNAPITTEHKYPLLLPSRSFYSNLVVHHYHQKNHHLGPNALLSIIRQKFWIPRGKSLVQFLKRKCVICTRLAKRSITPFMGDLPKSRFAAVRPFLTTGVDFAGPFLYRINPLRKSTIEKAYLCLFLCMSSRALHLEVATSLSVEGFLDAFDRFIARRGLPRLILSDNGTNFRGSDRYLCDLVNFLQDPKHQDQIIYHTAPQGITWSFNPPSAPHFGGGWEVSVKIVKDLLYKTFANRPFTFPELSTAFTRIEGILNSRPIQPLSSSPDDLEPLTPGHFLIGQPLNALPEANLREVPENRLSRWSLIRQRIQYFWDRWREEYLSDLQRRQKWIQRTPHLKIGDIVLMQDNNSPPTQWPLGRITEVHPGKDDIIRVVTIQTNKGTYRRPSGKVVPLILEDIHAPVDSSGS